jgi:pimeloyl-ACP methyl ester carboxylesterase
MIDVKRLGAILALLSGFLVPGTAHADTLRWGSCPDYGIPGPGNPTAGLDCATLRVPLDYAHPRGRTIELTISRHRSPDPAKRRGVLLMNPGGPGSPGLPMPAQLVARGASTGLLDSYDVIGFDPRGIGYSTPVTCDLTPEQRYIVVGPYAHSADDVTRQAEKARAVARQCADASTADLLPYLTTANTARDLDRVRLALGERKISYFGVSYGSYLGAVYSSLFAERTDRVVLDSVLGAGGLDVTAHRRFAQGFDDRFPDFTAWAATRDDTYRLGSTPDEVAATFDRVATDQLRADAWAALYADAHFPALAAEIGGLSAAAGPLDGDNHAAAQLAVLCNDSDWPADVRPYQRAVERERIAHPRFGPAAANVNPCAFWPNDPIEPPTRIGSRGPSNVLLVQNLRDPATPLVGARETRRAFGDRARMVTVDEGGHGVFLVGANACGNAAVVAYLRDGVRPAADTTCG